MSTENTASKTPQGPGPAERIKQLPFPPVTKNHILNCSYHSWHPKYRAVTPKARTVRLPSPFLAYLREDGIILPPDNTDNVEWSDSDSGIFSGADGDGEDDDEENFDPSIHWRDMHEEIKQVIDELGGKVAPKLNWSAPKDATWIAATNSMECRTPNDIYLLLKSSDFVTHDLQHAFDDTDDVAGPTPEIPYYVVLRKWITLNPSVEFRCFVRNRKLIALCQRDLNHFEFLFKMQDKLRKTIQEFFDVRLRDTFPDPNFTFDVYIPPPHDKVWLVDFNPWAMRTDPLLFSWMELLTLPELKEDEPQGPEAEILSGANGISLEPSNQDAEEINLFTPEFRLVRRDDPEAYGFTTPQYSAHKLPKDVVDASRGGEGNLMEFALQWKEAQTLAEQQRAEDSAEE
ncbi:cell division cycle protein-like protein [Zopfia rhizophila CBS 207.26]|uniref:Cell division cycle protein-like protein n=1 Tax=Zopfia rhizophila CBS 207.26 TaxID=1314779 RepID=A0A6A6DVV3_9PEZI|nr:cell division cycle protein-like protein [Zopfia rhizophila CBS 207.26]